jgi:hypothetical protein
MHPEDKFCIFLRKFDIQAQDYTVKVKAACSFETLVYNHRLHLEDEGSTLLRHFGVQKQDYPMTMKGGRSSETSVYNQKTAGCNSPVNHNLNSHSRENLKSCIR